MSEEDQPISSISYQDRLEAADVESFAPNLAGHWRKTSDPSLDYNCLAWAVGNNTKWFDPQRFCVGYHWPDGVEREWSMAAVIQILTLYGFSEESTNADLEGGLMKVAIYADSSGEPTHFARQLANGKWTSKAGELIDLEHENLTCLECDDYGKVVRILQRKMENSGEF